MSMEVLVSEGDKVRSLSQEELGQGQRRHHAAEDDEPSRKRSRYESEDSSSEDEYVLISSLTGNITHGSDDWLIDSGASKHMTGFKESFVILSEHESPHKVKLGYDYQYPIKGSGESSYKLDSGKSLTMKEVLFVSGLKKNLLSILALDEKGMWVAFIDGQVIMWPKGKKIDDAVVIGEQEGVLYKLKGHPEQGLIHDTVEHYLFHSKQSMMEFAKDVQKGRIQRRHFLAAKAKPKAF